MSADELIGGELDQLNQLTIEFEVESQTNGDRYLIAELFVDGCPIVDFKRYSLDLRAFNESLKGNGEYFLIACECGDPGCAGITRGVEVKHDGRLLRVHLSEPQPEQNLVFDLESCRTVLSTAVSRAKRLIAESTSPITIWPTNNQVLLD
jgi:hypothetical protein